MPTPFVQGLLPTPAPPVSVHLFDGPYVVIDGHRRQLPEGGKRLIVFIALNDRRVGRRVAAGTLWPNGDDGRAAGNLRSALWRLRGAGIDLLDVDSDALRLREDAVVDLDVVSDWAGRLIDGVTTAADTAPVTWRTGPLELLPGWYDEWVVFERERVRQRLLHGLEVLSRLLVRTGRHAEAVEAAMAVVAAEPLRESAQRVLVEAHLAEGNVGEARRSFTAYRSLVARELGVAPGAELTALVDRPPSVTRLPSPGVPGAGVPAHLAT